MDEQRTEHDETSVGGVKPDTERVKSRAEGRPPEERSSDDPRTQAEVVLEESEERIEERAAQSEPDKP